RSDVRFVAPAALARTNTGSVTSEGDRTHGANIARANFPTNGGSGIKIGVLSDGVFSLAASIANGNLNASTTVLQVYEGLAGPNRYDDGKIMDEGTAMMEIIQDIVPNAQIFFATAEYGPESMADNIKALRDAGCTIIVDDIIFGTESPFQDDVV